MANQIESKISCIAFWRKNSLYVRQSNFFGTVSIHIKKFNAISGSRASNATMSSQSSATKLKSSPDNRSLNNPKASSMDDTEDENEDGAHDTITSLAGAKMLQRYRRAISGSHKGSATSLSQVSIFYQAGIE